MHRKNMDILAMWKKNTNTTIVWRQNNTQNEKTWTWQQCEGGAQQQHK
jgi:hypothetical protein